MGSTTNTTRDAGQLFPLLCRALLTFCLIAAAAEAQSMPKGPSHLELVEGELGELKCELEGSGPTPVAEVTWRRGKEVVDGESGRYRKVGPTLQIVGVWKEDAGVWTCDLGNQVERTINVTVRGPSARSPARIVPLVTTGALNETLLARLYEPIVLRCFCTGYPRPSATWWRGDRMLPLSTHKFEQRRDYSLLIKLVEPEDLAPYSCQVYNGLGRAESWTITLKAAGNRTDPDGQVTVVDDKPITSAFPVLLINYKHKTCLHVIGGDQANVAGLALTKCHCRSHNGGCPLKDANTDQTWEIQRIQRTPTNSSTIVNSFTKKCVTVHGNGLCRGIVINQYDCVGQTNQEWELVAGNYGSDVFQIRSVRSGQCLTAEGSDGAYVDQWDCLQSRDRAPHQYWALAVYS